VIVLGFFSTFKALDGATGLMNEVIFKIVSADPNIRSEAPKSNIGIRLGQFKTIFYQNILAITLGIGKRFF
jgi:hypothetical protein